MIVQRIFEEHATEYFRLGFPVIPVEGKVPAISGWTQYCRRMPTSLEFDEWTKQFPDHNIGLCLGPAARLTAVDVDSDESSVRIAFFHTLPKTPLIKRGLKGFTAIYRSDEVPSTAVKLNRRHLVDILGDGRMTVLPPSIHPKGMTYEWVDWLKEAQCSVLS